MPSKITPKDFERFLPEERDTIAQGLLKYVQFVILFWRWYRNNYNSDGSLSYVFKDSTCRSGCLGSEGVVEGEPDIGKKGTEDEDGTGEASDDSRDKENPDPIPQNPPVPPGPNTPGTPADDCCPATTKEYSDFYFWEKVSHVDLKCNNYTKSVAVRNGSPRGIDFDTGGEVSSTFNTTLGWGNWSGGNWIPTDSSSAPVNDPGGYGQSQGELSKNSWQKVSIFIYGKTPTLWSVGADKDDNNKKRKPPIRGRVYYNDDKQHVDFDIKNGDDFGAEINITNLLVERGNMQNAIRQIRIHICPFHTLEVGHRNPSREDYWPLSVKNGRRLVEQPYLAHIYGIRMILVPPQFKGKEDPSRQLQVGYDVHEFQLVLDERWQNEIPCYVPTEIPEYLPVFGPVEAQPTRWTIDGMTEGIGEIYPHSVPNEWVFTSVSGRI